MSKIKTAILSFIVSELFILTIEMVFGVPLNVYYYLDLNLTKTTDVTFPFLLSNGEGAESSGGLIFMTNLLSMLLWLLTSPALLIAVVVYILAPDDESKP
ncbi:hypothetical protein [Methanosarcina horonobensis]|uniref:hypothetical protein n=1 Tax=Methanosarcina horonobensis TaxID=418008 RepID=UPI00138DF7CF|nr:hypothetical protein [Methanosarcina horonobensis]